MKRVLFAILSLAISATISAQEIVFDNGSAQVYSNGFVVSKGGFIVKETTITSSNGGTWSTWGIYSADGEVLVNLRTYDNEAYISVAYGTKVIANRALQRTQGVVYIPTTVEYLAPEALAFETGNEKGFTHAPRLYITDEMQDVSTSAKKGETVAQAEAEELARYNVQGMKLSEPEQGVNIVRMSDQTAKKVLVK